MTDTEIEFVPSPDRKVRKALSVLQLKEMGYQFDEIAEILNLPDAHTAEDEFNKGLARFLKEDPESRARLRVLANRRLEWLLRSVWKKAIDPDHDEQMVAQQRALAIIERHIKLYGLDSATKVDVEITPSEDELKRFVATLVAMKQDHPEEGDIFAPKIVEPPALEA